MLYQSTRGSLDRISSAEAIVKGLSDDGGLFVPVSLPEITIHDIENLINKPYHIRSAHILNLFLEDFDLSELEDYSIQAYTDKNNSNFTIAPIHSLNANTFILELWHGRTAAFKDMALQIMPLLLTSALKKTGENREVCILVATSGDTGKAALEGFCDVEGTKIMVFYPKDGVSEVQELQMTSQSGNNVNVAAVYGNFDDVQTGVKQIFSDAEFKNRLSDNGYILSSANSINWGRLLPQIVYYVSAYCDLVNTGGINIGDKINICVPTGNFGNILAGYYAKKIGLPINKMICASNQNNVLTDFIETGIYNKNRDFYTTSSPSMDILVSSNLERLLFELSDKNGEMIKQFMSALNDVGSYEITASMKNELTRIFASGFATEQETHDTIYNIYNEYNYLIDTHTAVAVNVLDKYRLTSDDITPTVVTATASPFKFCENVMRALGIQTANKGIELIKMLSESTNNPTPKPLADLHNKTPRFMSSIRVSEMKSAVNEFLHG